jgi:Pvc16 N-terminal domain
MSQYQVINSVGKTLKDVLWSEMRADVEISSLIAEDRIVFDNPHTLVGDAEPAQSKLSIFLYRILENSDMKNRDIESRNGNSTPRQPLFLNLFYLITPLANNAENNHHLLGKLMQILHDRCILKGALLKGVLEATDKELRVIFHPISMEDMTKLWSGFMRPYHLSIVYEVKVVTIDSERVIETEPVLRKRLEYTQL